MLRLYPDPKTVLPIKVDPLSRAMDQFLPLFGANKLKTHVAKTFPLHEAIEAQFYLQSRKSTGKVILTID